MTRIRQWEDRGTRAPSPPTEKAKMFTNNLTTNTQRPDDDSDNHKVDDLANHPEDELLNLPNDEIDRKHPDDDLTENIQTTNC